MSQRILNITVTVYVVDCYIYFTQKYSWHSDATHQAFSNTRSEVSLTILVSPQPITFINLCPQSPVLLVSFDKKRTIKDTNTSVRIQCLITLQCSCISSTVHLQQKLQYSQNLHQQKKNKYHLSFKSQTPFCLTKHSRFNYYSSKEASIHHPNPISTTHFNVLTYHREKEGYSPRIPTDWRSLRRPDYLGFLWILDAVSQQKANFHFVLTRKKITMGQMIRNLAKSAEL